MFEQVQPGRLLKRDEAYRRRAALRYHQKRRHVLNMGADTQKRPRRSYHVAFPVPQPRGGEEIEKREGTVNGEVEKASDTARDETILRTPQQEVVDQDGKEQQNETQDVDDITSNLAKV